MGRINRWSDKRTRLAKLQHIGNKTNEQTIHRSNSYREVRATKHSIYDKSLQ